LRVELEREGKVNRFVDRRLGENNEKLSSEEKALRRLQKEIKRANRKKSIYSLEDDEATLTHLGVSIADLKKGKRKGEREREGEGRKRKREKKEIHFLCSSVSFVCIDDLVLSDDDDDDDDDVNSARQKKRLEELTFGGFDNSNNENGEKKSRDQIIKEIIVKSKLHKAERAKDKAHREDLMEQVDQQFNGIRMLLKPRPKKWELPEGKNE
jgi:nucleolar protein 14